MHASFILGALATVLSTSLAAPTAETVEERQFAIPYWEVHCFTDRAVYLDHDDTNDSNIALQEWAGDGKTIETKDHNKFVSFPVGNAQVYACCDQHYGSDTFTADRIRSAMEAMDGQCDSYETSYAIWPDSSAIVGKDVVDFPICQGYRGS